jgi:hypothetical protein
MQISTATIATEVAKQGRANRSPEHTFALSNMPYQIQPFMIAPVLPGETLKNALLQSRAVTDPISNPLIGWHLEYYVFYVKLRDLDIREEVTDMLLSGAQPPNWVNPLSVGQTIRPDSITGNVFPTVNWTRRCLDRVVAEYFRDEGDDPTLLGNAADNTYLGLPRAAIEIKDRWFQSVKKESAMPAGDDGTLPGENDNADENIPAEWAGHYEQYKRMRALKLTEVTFEDYLRQFGVRAPAEVREELHQPELLRYIRDWTYPSNTVDPATGTPSSACSWSIAERLDKSRFFKEPGFIFGVTLSRPKVYLGRQYSNAVEMLNDPYTWLPAILQDDPFTSLKRFTGNSGPLGHPLDPPSGANEAYWVDVRDLFLYGDQMTQFVGGQGGEVAINRVALPDANLQRRYCSDADIKAFFKTAAKCYVRQDGVMQLTIAGNQKDHT